MKRFLHVFILILIVSLFAQCNKKRTPEDCVEKNQSTDCICTQEYDPVCGCNNVTYSNSCEASCSGITDFTKGACK